MELSGPVTITTDGSSEPDYIDFYLQLAAGGTSVDLSKVTYTLSTPTAVVTYVDSAATGSPQVTRTYVMGTGTNLLEPRQMVLITVGIGGGSEFTAANLGVNTKFIIEVKPSGGASLPIGRTTPAAYSASKSYEVF
jgi:flagellin FlaB